VRLLARHQKFGTTNRFGLPFGLKLPHRSLRPELCDGRLAGQLLDRDCNLAPYPNLILELPWFTRPTVSLGAFVQATLEQPLSVRFSRLPLPPRAVSCVPGNAS